MLSLILAGLYLSSPVSVSYQTQDGNLAPVSRNDAVVTPIQNEMIGSDITYGYHVQLPYSATNDFVRISTNSGYLNVFFHWEFWPDTGNAPLVNTHALYVANYDKWGVFGWDVDDDKMAVLSNLYLTNFYALDDSNGDKHRLPDIFFNGSLDVMDSQEEGTLCFDSYYQDDYYGYEFDLMMMPSSLISDSGSYWVGYNTGFADGVESQAPEINNAYQNGYTEGYNEAFEANVTAVTIFSGILQIAMVPVNFFLGIFNFEILGINIAGFVSALLTVAVTVIIIRLVIGGKNDGK